MQVVEVHSAGYEIFRSLYRHWTNDRFPLVTTTSVQDNIQSLTFECHGKELHLGMNLAYLRDRSIPVTVIFGETTLDGDLMDTSFLTTKLDVLMEALFI